MDDRVLNWINDFKKENPTEIENKYLYGDCWVFAAKLSETFGGSIWYLPVWNHFVCRIGYQFYDISGLVRLEKGDKIYSWFDYQTMEPMESARIIRDCIANKETI